MKRLALLVAAALVTGHTSAQEVGVSVSITRPRIVAGAGGAVAPSSLLNGLVSFWPLSEQGGTRTDFVGGFNLTDNNTVLYENVGPNATVVENVAANSEYLRSPVNFNPLGGSYTVVIWQYYAPSSGRVFVNSAVGNLGATSAFNFFSVAGEIVMNAFDNSGGLSQSFFAVPDASVSRWRMYAGGWRSSDNKSFVSLDGATKVVNSAANAGARTNADSLHVGANSGGFFDIRASRLGYWSRELTNAELTSIYNEGFGKAYADLSDSEKSGLVSYWDLDETSGNRADSHGANTLTDNNTVGSLENSMWPANLPGIASTYIAANTEFLSRDPQTFLVSGQPRSLSFWAKRTVTAGNNDTLFMFGNSTGDGARILDVIGQGTDPTSLLSIFAGGGSASSAGFYSANQWMNVVYTFDGTDHLVYADNVLRITRTAADSGNSGAFFIGNGPASSADMTMSTFAFWDRVLTPAERACLFNNGAGSVYPYTGLCN